MKNYKMLFFMFIRRGFNLDGWKSKKFMPLSLSRKCIFKPPKIKNVVFITLLHTWKACLNWPMKCFFVDLIYKNFHIGLISLMQWNRYFSQLFVNFQYFQICCISVLEVESGLLRMTGRMTGRAWRVYRIELSSS